MTCTSPTFVAWELNSVSSHEKEFWGTQGWGPSTGEQGTGAPRQSSLQASPFSASQPFSFPSFDT